MQTQNICHDVLVELRKIMRAIDLHSKKLMQSFGLTGPQMIILKEIIKAERMPISLLAKNASLSHATVTSILDRLAKKEYVVRVRDVEDKRKIYVQASEQAKELISRAPALLQENFIEEFIKLEDWEQSLLLSSLQRIASMMNAKKIDASPILINHDIE
ncbi:MAG: MarR family transcriptional regulator [Gammaproteobacteria bacterium 39-13]|nr:MarR family transcriptional regulator [Gammaproteobacteria bacterium]OJV94292.1 MAG: MarR family transcriptional regulator [Gammaproteobacteria bacterium 39-13]